MCMHVMTRKHFIFTDAHVTGVFVLLIIHDTYRVLLVNDYLLFKHRRTHLIRKTSELLSSMGIGLVPYC